MSRIEFVLLVYSCPEPQDSQKLSLLGVKVLNDAKPEWESQMNPSGKTASIWIDDPIQSIDVEEKAAEAFGQDVVDTKKFAVEEKKFKTEDGQGLVLLYSSVDAADIS